MYQISLMLLESFLPLLLPSSSSAQQIVAPHILLAQAYRKENKRRLKATPQFPAAGSTLRLRANNHPKIQSRTRQVQPWPCCRSRRPRLNRQIYRSVSYIRDFTRASLSIYIHYYSAYDVRMFKGPKLVEKILLSFFNFRKVAGVIGQAWLFSCVDDVARCVMWFKSLSSPLLFSTHPSLLIFSPSLISFMSK